MRVRMLTSVLIGVVLASSLSAQTATRSQSRVAHPHQPVHSTRQAPLTAQERAAQIVDRFTFGSTPGMVEAVAAEGWQHWFAQQLDPASIPDAALQKRLQNYPSLSMTPQQIAVAFPDGQVIRRIANGKQAMPEDGELAGVYEVMLARYGERQAKEKAEANAAAGTVASPAGGAPPNAAGPPVEGTATGIASQLQGQDSASRSKPETDAKAEQRAGQTRADLLAGPILPLPAPARLQAVLALPVPDRMTLTRDLQDPWKTQLLQGVSPRDRELWGLMAGGYAGSGVAASELEQAKLLRAVLSQRQLQEVMTDFWVNHFNIDLSKSGDEINYANQYEEQVIRPHALGKFRDLLLATAESPAMMIYLDNPDSPAALGGAKAKKNTKAGLNENYGREVMELHTVGVDGGYTQADVTALAGILTGWGVDQPNQGGPFVFQQRRHEPGTKQWMGHTVTEAGQQEGLDALADLAAQPATARHISLELAQRFVADIPPPALVDRMTATWMRTDGDIAEVLRTMVASPEFFDRANFHNKVKMPLEFVASSLRATGTDPTNPGVLAQQLRAMGEPLYRCQPPTGYPVTGQPWMNSAALIARLNFALALSEGRLGGMHLNAPLLVATGLMTQPPEPEGRLATESVRKGLCALPSQSGASPAQPWDEVLPLCRTRKIRLASLPTATPAQVSASMGEDRALVLLEQALIAGEVSPQTNSVIRAQLAERDAAADATNPTDVLDAMAAMILGSPEFQLH